MAPQPPSIPKIKKLIPMEIVFGVPFGLGIMGLFTVSISTSIAAVFAGAAIISFIVFAIIVTS